MIYKVTVERYKEWEDKMVTSYMFVCADSTVKAVQQVSDYFGEECIEDLTISPFSPDDFLVVDKDSEELFHDFANRVSEDIVWQELVND